MDLKSAWGKEKWYYEYRVYFANWGIFAMSLDLLLKIVPVSALLDHRVIAARNN